jgi:predicted anti-sigma-YlaC factor YlaD
MDIRDSSDCIATLLDMLSYELQGSRLSSEIEGLLERHLDECSACRRKFADFHQVATEREVVCH